MIRCSVVRQRHQRPDSYYIDRLTDLSDVKFCHGTSSASLPTMTGCGLTPRNRANGCRESTWGGKLESEEGLVYLSAMDTMLKGELRAEGDLARIEGREVPGIFGGGICAGAAEEAVKKRGGNEVIFEIELNNGFKPFLEYDEDMSALRYTPITKGWVDYINDVKNGHLLMANPEVQSVSLLEPAYKMTREEEKMSISDHTCESVLAGGYDAYGFHEDVPNMMKGQRKAVQILGYDIYPGAGNIHSDTDIPSPTPEKKRMLEELRNQPPEEAKAQIRRICRALPDWYKSLLAIGTVAVREQIPPENIKVRFARPPKEIQDQDAERFGLLGNTFRYVHPHGVPLEEFIHREHPWFTPEETGKTEEMSWQR